MVGAGVVAGDDVLEDFDARPEVRLVVAPLVFVLRPAGALRFVVLLAGCLAASRAFCFSSFSFSRASYTSLEGIFKVTRFNPEVKESISSFSWALTGAALFE